MLSQPNFSVVGAAKAGTTSLCSWLKQHPDVFVPQIKELSFLCMGMDLVIGKIT